MLEGNKILTAYDEKRFSEEYNEIIPKIQNILTEQIREAIDGSFREEYCGMRKQEQTDGVDKACENDKAEMENMDWIPLNSIGFYLFLIIFCDILSQVEFKSKDGENIDDKKKKKKRENYELHLNARFQDYAEKIAAAWGITDQELTVLIADCITCMYGNISARDYFEKKSTFRNNLRLPLRADMGEILKKYTKEPDNMTDKDCVYDFYSDYYFFYIMDYMNSHS